MKDCINWKKTGMNIKVLMSKNGYTPRTIAPILNVSESTIKNYIYAGTKVPLEILFQMADIFNLNGIDDILVLENPQK